MKHNAWRIVPVEENKANIQLTYNKTEFIRGLEEMLEQAKAAPDSEEYLTFAVDLPDFYNIFEQKPSLPEIPNVPGIPTRRES